MSLGLVNYESSSDESDSGEGNENVKLNESSVQYLPVKGPSVGAGLLKAAQPSSSGRDAKPPGLGGLFSSLPSPKAVKEHGNSEEDLVTTSNSKLSISPQTKKSNAIKIVAPSLPEPDSDSDEEPQTKKVKTGKKISSLFAMLPEPKHATLKQTNRLLIPHTLTKKKPDLPSSVKTSQPAKAASHLPVIRSSENDGGDDYDNENNSNFFSLSIDKDGISSVSSKREKKQVITFDNSTDTQPIVQVSHEKHERQKPVSQEQVTPSVPQTRPKNVALPEEPSRTVSSKLVSPSINQSEATVETSPSTSQRGSKLLKSIQPDMNEQPLNFSNRRTPSYVQPDMNEQPLSFSNKRTPYGYQSQPSASYGYPTQLEQDGVSNQDCGNYQEGYPGYQQQEYPMYHEQYDGGSGYPGGHSGAISSSMIQDKDFQRMIGKGKFDPSAANIIDVNADDHISTVRAEDWMLKSMTEEKQAREKLSKEELPTSQQKRKHQITYLARQAKERELELKNSWAQNRMTRKQTQAKYGF